VKQAIIGTMALLAGLYAGEWLPDADQDFSFITHRSIFTHGLIVPVILFGLASVNKTLVIRTFVIGFCLGAAVHLSYDLFPRAWQGFALIHVPAIGWTYPLVSWVWIAGSMAISLYAALRLVSGLFQGIAVLAVGAAMFGYTGLGEATLLGPAASVAMATILAMAILLWRQASNSE
jgi:hypothetical protein